MISARFVHLERCLGGTLAAVTSRECRSVVFVSTLAVLGARRDRIGDESAAVGWVGRDWQCRIATCVVWLLLGIEGTASTIAVESPLICHTKKAL